MTDPKVFTGPGGYTFTLYEGPVPSAAGVIVSYPGAPLDHGTWIPIADLRAFVSANAMVIYSRAHAPPEPQPPADILSIPGPPGSRVSGDARAIGRTVGSYEPDAPRADRAEARRDFPPGTRVLAVEPRCGLCKDTGWRAHREPAGALCVEDPSVRVPCECGARMPIRYVEARPVAGWRCPSCQMPNCECDEYSDPEGGTT